VLCAELAEVATALLKEASDPAARWELLQPLIRELANLRRGDHNADRVNMELERWNLANKKGRP